MCAASTAAINLDEIGVTKERLEAMVTSDYKDAKHLFETKRGFAIKQLINKVHTVFNSKYKANSMLKSGTLGHIVDNLKVDAGSAGKLRGIRLQLCSVHSYVDVHISRISLFTNFTGDIPVEVWDLKQNVMIDTFTVAVTGNQITRALVNKTYESFRKELDIILVYDTTGIDAFRVRLSETGCAGCGSGTDLMKVNRYLRASGVEVDNADTKIDENVDNISNTAGMCLDYSITCNTEDWLCDFSNLLNLPIAYLTAAELMKFGRWDTNRQNTTTIINSEEMEELFDFYMAKYEESLNNVLKNIKPPDDRECFECRKVSRAVSVAM